MKCRQWNFGKMIPRIYPRTFIKEPCPTTSHTCLPNWLEQCYAQKCAQPVWNALKLQYDRWLKINDDVRAGTIVWMTTNHSCAFYKTKMIISRMNESIKRLECSILFDTHTSSKSIRPVHYFCILKNLDKSPLHK